MKADAKLGDWNRFRILMRGDRADVYLNNKLVIDNAQMPGIPKKGRVGLQHQGSPVDFANLFIRELGNDE